MTMTALIIGKSLANIDSMNKLPTPGMPKKRSTMKDVNAIPAKENPSMVTTGIIEFRRTCRRWTVKSERPLERAVRM